MTVIVSHLGRGENSLLLWNNSKQTAPICSFVGHTDVVLDFAWRPNRTEMSDLELITWSRDQTVRVWKVDETLQRLCEEPEPEEDESIDLPPYKPMPDWAAVSSLSPTHHSAAAAAAAARMRARRLADGPPPPCSLQHEFSLLNTNIPHIDVEALDPFKRNATVRISANGHIILLLVVFPLAYPGANQLPTFTYCQGTSIDADLSVALMKVLRATALQRCKKGRSCLEQCLRALVTALKKVCFI